MRGSGCGFDLLWQHGGQVGDRVRNPDGILVTNDLTEPATHTGLFVHHRNFEMIIWRAWIGLQGDAVERTDINAIFARGTIVGNDLRLGDFLQRNTADENAILILDTRNGAVDGTDATLDTTLGMDLEDGFFSAGNRVRRTLLLADTATDASLGDEIGHDSRGNDRHGSVPPPPAAIRMGRSESISSLAPSPAQASTNATVQL